MVQATIQQQHGVGADDGPLRPLMGLISNRMLREEVADLRAALDAAAAG